MDSWALKAPNKVALGFNPSSKVPLNLGKLSRHQIIHRFFHMPSWFLCGWRSNRSSTVSSVSAKIMSFCHTKYLLCYFIISFYNISFIRCFIIQFYILLYIKIIFTESIAMLNTLRSHFAHLELWNPIL